MGLKADSVWSWGKNYNGQVGDNTTAIRSSPVSVVGAHTFTAVNGSGPNRIGIKADGSAWCWGRGNYGTIGNNAVTDRSSPVSVVGAHSFIKVAVHSNSSRGTCLALKVDGSVWTWGYNNNGQIGDNTSGASRSSPVSVVGSHSFIDIAGGYYNSFGLKADGSKWGWGRGSAGALGQHSTYDSRSSPVSVVGDHKLAKITNFDSGASHGGGIKLFKTLLEWQVWN
jgi:alpha-tubulin suppressor-like RCC1 family protein